MKERNEIKSKHRSTGCLIALITGIALVAWAFWQIGEPARRARRIHAAVRKGMSFEDVDTLLTGHHYCFFQVGTNEQWSSIAREEFSSLVEAGGGAGSAPQFRLQLHFMGMSPRRVTFSINIDQSGNVINTSDPYGWD